MRTKFIVAILLILASTTTAQTLEECQKAAEKNYPLIKQYIEADFQPGNIYCVEEDTPNEHLTLHSMYKEVVDQKQKV